MAKQSEITWKTTVLAATWLVGLAVPGTAQTVANRQVTFSKDIAPILQRSCQNCHRPDSVAPMSLLTYADARPYARSIKQRTALRYAQWQRGVMPPWYIEKNIGIQKFKEDVSLSDAEIALIGAWADAGAPEGNPADLPPPLKFANGAEWALGKPDLIVSSPSVFVPAVRSDQTGEFGVSPRLNLAEDRYTASAEFKEISETDLRGKNANGLGARFVFHHAELRDADDDNSQFTNGVIVLAPHEVGRNGEIYPNETGLLLKKDLQIAWNGHIHSSGIDRNAHLDLGFKLRPAGFKPKYLIRGGAGGGSSQIQVDPNLANQRQETFTVLQQNIKLLNFEPHLHSTGTRMCLRAINGAQVETLSCAAYDHNWVRNYQFDENYAPLLPKGTIIQTIAWFDNTAVNKNVLDPRNLSRFGFTSVANMLLTFNKVIQLTDEEYKAEIAKRKEFLRQSGEEDDIIGCPDCYERNAPPNYLISQAAATGSK